ncbi:MAG: hypothetical protein JWQ49_5274 [Edaphobacter sp.]|nr:hypothetical protein [Edaphobacter sp.]
MNGARPTAWPIYFLRYLITGKRPRASAVVVELISVETFNPHSFASIFIGLLFEWDLFRRSSITYEVEIWLWNLRQIIFEREQKTLHVYALSGASFAPIFGPGSVVLWELPSTGWKWIGTEKCRTIWSTEFKDRFVIVLSLQQWIYMIRSIG